MTSPKSPQHLGRGYFIILCAALSFGLYPSGAKIAYSDGANSTFLILITTLARTLTLTMAAIYRGTKVRGIIDGIGSSVGTGFLQALTIVGIIMSLQYISGPVMITIVFTHTLMLLAILCARKEATLSPLAVGTSLVALVGIALVVNVFHNFNASNLIGVTLALVAALGSATRLYVYGKQVVKLDSALVGARAFLVASSFVLLLIFFDTPQPPRGLAGVAGSVLACVSMMLGTLLTFLVLRALGSFRTSLMLKCEPVFTCLFSWLILGERLVPTQYIGVALVLGSLVWFQYAESRLSRLPADSEE